MRIGCSSPIKTFDFNNCNNCLCIDIYVNEKTNGQIFYHCNFWSTLDYQKGVDQSQIH